MREIDALKAARRQAAAVAMKLIAEDLLGEAQRQAPVDEGTLRGSGQAHVTMGDHAVTAEVSFSTPYAARQHEEVTNKHPKGGKAKYLEDPLKAKSQRYVAVLAAAIRKAS